MDLDFFKDIPRLLQRNFSTVPPNPPNMPGLELTRREQAALQRADSLMIYSPAMGAAYAAVGWWFNTALCKLFNSFAIRRGFGTLPGFAMKGLGLYSATVGGLAGLSGYSQMIRKRLLASLPASSELRRRMMMEQLPYLPFPPPASEDPTDTLAIAESLEPRDSQMTSASVREDTRNGTTSVWEEIRAKNRSNESKGG